MRSTQRDYWIPDTSPCRECAVGADNQDHQQSQMGMKEPPRRTSDSSTAGQLSRLCDRKVACFTWGLRTLYSQLGKDSSEGRHSCPVITVFEFIWFSVAIIVGVLRSLAQTLSTGISDVRSAVQATQRCACNGCSQIVTLFTTFGRMQDGSTGEDIAAEQRM